MTIESLEEGHFRSALSRDLLGMALGPMIGEGQFRCVYSWIPDPTLVAKIEPAPASGDYCNAMEWRIWDAVHDRAISKWFAPIVQVSGCGFVALQKRTTPVTANELPKRVPAFFTDLKTSNWGRLDGRVVCHDYGHNLLLEYGLTAGLRKADWTP